MAVTMIPTDRNAILLRAVLEVVDRIDPGRLEDEENSQIGFLLNEAGYERGPHWDGQRISPWR